MITTATTTTTTTTTAPLPAPALTQRHLRLSAACQLKPARRGLAIANREQEILVESRHADALEKIFRTLYGGAQPVQASTESTAQTGVEGVEGAALASALEPVLAMLLADDLLLDTGRATRAAQAADLPETAEALRREARFWAKPIFEQPFWEQLLAGHASRAQVLGWGVEFYHFVDAANSYMPLGVAHTRHTPALREAITRHYVEEMHHGLIFLDGLSACGIERASIHAAPPLPHTKALIHQLVELAYEGELPYSAAFAVMQPGLSRTSEAALGQFYGKLSELYPYASAMFNAFHRHAALDIEMRHEETVFAKLCQTAPGLSSGQCQLASETMQAVAESFMLFFEGIRDFYGAQEASSFAPRRPLYLAALRPGQMEAAS